MSSQMAKQYSPAAVEKSYVLLLLLFFFFSCMKLTIIVFLSFLIIFSSLLADLGGMNGGRNLGSL